MVGYDSGSGSAVISDTNGNQLFYTDGHYIFRKDHGFMYTMTSGNRYPGMQASVIIPKPGSDHIFYAFFVNNWWTDLGNMGNPLIYVTIDMDLNGGFGGVTSLDTVHAAWDAADKLMAVYHKHKHDIWVLTRKYATNYFAAVPVTDDGVLVEDIVLSPAPEVNPEGIDGNFRGYMKVSYDKKYVVTTFMDWFSFPREVEICTFNPEMGEINFLYAFNPWNHIPPFDHAMVTGLELSPDSKYLYISRGYDSVRIYQYDMQYILDSTAFFNSYVYIGTGEGQSLQLASDGKIYLSQSEMDMTESLGVINKPWLHGTACDYQPDAVFVGWEKVGYTLPTFMTDFLYRFDFDGKYALDTFYFDPWFFPQPTWIQWDFGDPASGSQNVSNNLHSKHVFTKGGEFEVSVLLTYPSGRVEKTSRVVQVDSIPFPDLGGDTLIFKGSNLELNANCNGQYFTWSTGQWGASSIIVSDTGYYWVKASYANGCDNYDTIYVGYHPSAQFDETGLVITPTACGGFSGSITGLIVTGTAPINYSWKDLSGTILGDTLNLNDLGVGQYYLEVTNGNGCVAQSEIYTIIDAGSGFTSYL